MALRGLRRAGNTQRARRHVGVFSPATRQEAEGRLALGNDLACMRTESLELMTDYGANMLKTPLTVAHASLAPWSADSSYRAKCPACPNGILMVYRNEKTMALQRADCCISCGQRFHYTDESIAGEPFEPDNVYTASVRYNMLEPR